MAMGLKVTPNIDSLKKFQEYIDYVKKFSTLSYDREFQKYIQNKFLETVNKISLERLSGGTMSQEYISNNKIRELDDGFVLYNDTTVDTDSEGYDGTFCIALAFEYGTGIIGQNNPREGAWQYNVKGHTDGWWYPSNWDDPNPIKWVDKDGNIRAFTRGMQGYEIYRYTQEEIKKQLTNWIKEYKKKDGGASQ